MAENAPLNNEFLRQLALDEELSNDNYRLEQIEKISGKPPLSNIWQPVTAVSNL